MINWFKQQLIKLYLWIEKYPEQTTDEAIIDVKNLINTVHNTKYAFNPITLWVIKGDLELIAKYKHTTKYKAFENVFYTTELTAAEIEEYRVLFKDWFSK